MASKYDVTFKKHSESFVRGNQQAWLSNYSKLPTKAFCIQFPKYLFPKYNSIKNPKTKIENKIKIMQNPKACPFILAQRKFIVHSLRFPCLPVGIGGTYVAALGISKP